MQTDEGFHELSRDFPDAVFALVSGHAPRVRYEATSPVLKKTERRVDTLLRPVEARGRSKLVEWLDYRDPEAERKLWLKSAMLCEGHDLWDDFDVAIVYTKREYAQAAIPVRLPGRRSRIWRPRRIVLEDLTPAELLAASPGLVGLIPLTSVTKAEIHRRLKAWWRESARRTGATREEQMTWREHFEHFYAQRFPGDTLELANRILEGAMRFEETQIGRDLLALGEKKGIRKGRRRGRKKGREEGREEGAREALIRAIGEVLVARFGDRPAELDAWFEAHRDPEVMQEAHRLALAARGRADFLRRLRRL